MSKLFRAAKCLAPSIVIALTLFGGALSLQADVFGRLAFTVKDADDEKPVAAAKITLHDSAGVRGDIILTTDSDGAAVSPPLEFAHAWDVTVEGGPLQTRQPAGAGSRGYINGGRSAAGASERKGRKDNRTKTGGHSDADC